MDKLTLQNPLFSTYVVAATIMILKAASMSWLTVVRMMQAKGGYRSPEDLKKTPLNPNPDPKQLEPNEAVARFGAFPYWMYAYNSASTVSNILFAEPTNGRFSITWNLASGGLQPWELVHLGSSLGMTSLIAWWGIRSLRRAAAGSGSIEPRAFLAMLATLLACGVLSFDYSRDRLGGMAAVFYAISAYFALRAAAAYVVAAPRSRFIAGSLALALLAGAWQIRAVGTLEWTRRTSGGNQAGWLMQLPQRRMEFADRSTYLQIMQSMIEQGTNPAAPRPTRYPHLISITIGPQ